MIDMQAAESLLDFGARIGGGPRAQEQLQGAVAIHNILEEQGVAYLADEVGMGKTYVALGALALFRHFNPGFRVLVLAPRENIQNKWMKELRNFVAHNVRFPDLRIKSLENRPVRPLVACANLLDLVHEAGINPNRDFFLRLTSFSLPISGKDKVDSDAARPLRDGLRKSLPWIEDEVFDLRAKTAFKDNVAKAICCALPVFDLVIVDEGHNLKHGFGANVSARNRVLALAMGHSDSEGKSKLFPKYGPRAKRVLFLSATPVEETYTQLWNQLEIFGQGRKFPGLRDPELDEESKKTIAKRFLIRRVTAITVAGKEHTKNLYRREWRRGGVLKHDRPIRVEDPKQRLIVALVQKKVAELLRHEKFNSNFQIGMLASFESFLETAKLKREDGDGSNFDDTEQTGDELEKEGIDVADINRMAASYRKRFKASMPHPKMDALVDALSRSWTMGEKSLIFVRRVASVKEIKIKLDERYDRWLMDRLRQEMPKSVLSTLEKVFRQYAEEKSAKQSRTEAMVAQSKSSEDSEGEWIQNEELEAGGQDTFFAWFFRGEGPKGVISGANVQQRFIQRGTLYSTFFEDNHVAALFGCEPSETEARVADYLGMTESDLADKLKAHSKRFIGRAKKLARGDRFEAIQASAIELVKDRSGPLQEKARIIWHQRFEASIKVDPAKEGTDAGHWLSIRTFFTDLRSREDLRKRLWPVSSQREFSAAFKEQELRGQLLASAARLGHPLIELYVLTIRRLGSMALRTQDAGEEESDSAISPIAEFLDILELQRTTPVAERGWGAFDELAEISEHFDLILDVNEPEARNKPLSETALRFGQLLRQQQPVGGMSGQVNQTLVRQFRMPGYPFVLITTDLLQEGEDLHSFCSSIHHYGISWTPSSMEQRIGRVDRVRSQTERRLSHPHQAELAGNDMLQVYFPYLEDTVEVLQVRKVLERMNVFLRLMHEGLLLASNDERTINTGKEFLRENKPVEKISGRLHTAFPIQDKHLVGPVKLLKSGPEIAIALEKRFHALGLSGLPGLTVRWEPQIEPVKLLGTLTLGSRIQPFSLLLQSKESHAVVRCISPIGRIQPDEYRKEILSSLSTLPAHLGVILTKDARTYDLTVEGDVLLGHKPESDGLRVAMLVLRIAKQADALEYFHLPGQDHGIDAFRTDMEAEGRHER